MQAFECLQFAVLLSCCCCWVDLCRTLAANLPRLIRRAAVLPPVTHTHTYKQSTWRACTHTHTHKFKIRLDSWQFALPCLCLCLPLPGGCRKNVTHHRCHPVAAANGTAAANVIMPYTKQRPPTEAEAEAEQPQPHESKEKKKKKPQQQQQQRWRRRPF